MTTLEQLLARETCCARIARLLLSKRGEWFDGRLLAEVGGAYAWRTRASDLRRAPWYLDVENKQERITCPDGSTVVVSCYRIVAPVSAESSAA
jgi:hypothetical protein